MHLSHYMWSRPLRWRSRSPYTYCALSLCRERCRRRHRYLEKEKAGHPSHPVCVLPLPAGAALRSGALVRSQPTSETSSTVSRVTEAQLVNLATASCIQSTNMYGGLRGRWCYGGQSRHARGTEVAGPGKGCTDVGKQGRKGRELLPLSDLRIF